MPNGKSKAAGKMAERALVKLLVGVDSGIRRFPADSGGPADLAGDWLVVQSKHRAAFPQWLEEAVMNAELAAAYLEETEGKEYTAITVLHQKQAPYLSSYVLMRLDEFMRLAKGGTSDHS